MKMKRKMITVPLCGDIYELTCRENRMIAIGRTSPTDFARMLDAITNAYSGDKRKVSARIRELASELSKLYKRDCNIMLLPEFLVSGTETIELKTKQL